MPQRQRWEREPCLMFHMAPVPKPASRPREWVGRGASQAPVRKMRKRRGTTAPAAALHPRDVRDARCAPRGWATRLQGMSFAALRRARHDLAQLRPGSSRTHRGTQCCGADPGPQAQPRLIPRAIPYLRSSISCCIAYGMTRGERSHGIVEQSSCNKSLERNTNGGSHVYHARRQGNFRR